MNPYWILLFLELWGLLEGWSPYGSIQAVDCFVEVCDDLVVISRTTTSDLAPTLCGILKGEGGESLWHLCVFGLARTSPKKISTSPRERSSRYILLL